MDEPSNIDYFNITSNKTRYTWVISHPAPTAKILYSILNSSFMTNDSERFLGSNRLRDAMAILMIAVAVIATMLAISLSEESDAATSGTCGEDLAWELDSKGQLTVSGTGDMNDYSKANPAPSWPPEQGSLHNRIQRNVHSRRGAFLGWKQPWPCAAPFPPPLSPGWSPLLMEPGVAQTGHRHSALLASLFLNNDRALPLIWDPLCSSQCPKHFIHNYSTL